MCPWTLDQCDVWDCPYGALTTEQKAQVRREFACVGPEEVLKGYNFSRRRSYPRRPGRWYGSLAKELAI